MNKQLFHNEISFTKQEFNITILADNIRTPENIGMIYRISDAFGVEQIIFTGNETQYLNKKKIERISRNTSNVVKSIFSAHPEEILNELIEKQYHFIALDITSESRNIETVNFSNFKNIALIIGSERNGISSYMLNKTDLSVHIQLYGINSSMNVVNALSIALYEITKQLKNS